MRDENEFDLASWGREAARRSTISDQMAQETGLWKMADEIERLRAALIERDGGVHDQDCKALRDHGPKACTCGHDEVVRLTQKEGK